MEDWERKNSVTTSVLCHNHPDVLATQGVEWVEVEGGYFLVTIPKYLLFYKKGFKSFIIYA